MKKLSRNEMKKVIGGVNEEAKPICTACTLDAQCSTGHVCRASTSCIEAKVCALPYLC